MKPADRALQATSSVSSTELSAARSQASYAPKHAQQGMQLRKAEWAEAQSAEKCAHALSS
eukprot:365462-Chlamydomonas_euryale.AAC.6